MSELPELKKMLATDAPTILSPLLNWAEALIQVKSKEPAKIPFVKHIKLN